VWPWPCSADVVSRKTGSARDEGHYLFTYLLSISRKNTAQPSSAIQFPFFPVVQTLAVAAPAQQRSQVISRSEHPRARSPQKSWRPFLVVAFETQTPLRLLHCQSKTNKAVRRGKIFIYCSLYYRSKDTFWYMVDHYVSVDIRTW